MSRFSWNAVWPFSRACELLCRVKLFLSSSFSLRYKVFLFLSKILSFKFSLSLFLSQKFIFNPYSFSFNFFLSSFHCIFSPKTHHPHDWNTRNRAQNLYIRTAISVFSLQLTHTQIFSLSQTVFGGWKKNMRKSFSISGFECRSDDAEGETFGTLLRVSQRRRASGKSWKIFSICF